VLWQWGRLTRRQGALADAEVLSAIVDGVALGRRRWRWLLGLVAVACWIVALANPQFGTRTRVSTVKATELMLALDVSESMLADDVRPNRLSRGQALLLDILGTLDGEQVGLVLFAGQAYLQIPLTTDYGTVGLFVRSATPNLVQTQGTNFSAALSLLRETLSVTEEERIGTRRLAVLVSDGEDHEQPAEQLAETLANDGIRLYTVGVGTQAGSTIPTTDRSQGNVKRDAGGETVITRFDPETLRELAELGGGQYFDLATNALGVAGSIGRAIEEGPSGSVGEEVFLETASYYQVFVALGLIAWLAGWAVVRDWRSRTAEAAHTQPTSGGRAVRKAESNLSKAWAQESDAYLAEAPSAVAS